MEGGASFNPSISKNLFSSVYIYIYIYRVVPIYPCLKKNTCYHPLVVAIISFVRSIIREEKEKKFPNTKKFPITLRFILPSVDPSLKNSHVTRVKPTVRQITWRIEKPFNLIDSNSKDARCIRVWKRAKRMLIRTRDWNELKSWRDSVSGKYLLPWGSIEINIAIR